MVAAAVKEGVKVCVVGDGYREKKEAEMVAAGRCWWGGGWYEREREREISKNGRFFMREKT